MDIEKLPLTKIVARLTVRQTRAIVVAACTVLSLLFYLGYYVARFTYESKLAEQDRQLQRYSSQWAAIQPQLRSQRFLDIADQIVSVYSRDVPAGSTVVGRDFIAPMDLPGLVYSKTTLPEYRSIFGEQKISVCSTGLDDLAAVHLWKSGSARKLASKQDQQLLLAHIMMQKISKPRLQTKLIDLFTCWRDNAKSDFRISPQAETQVREVAKNLDQLDIVELYYSLLQFASFVKTVFDPKYVWTHTDAQKSKQVLVATNFFTYKDLNALDDHGKVVVFPEYYLQDRVIMVEVPRNIHFINIVSHSSEITGDAKFDELSNRWVAGLRFFYD